MERDEDGNIIKKDNTGQILAIGMLIFGLGVIAAMAIGMRSKEKSGK